MISAIVLAAGTSSRMGSPKPLLTFGGRPLLERVLETVRDPPVDDIVVLLDRSLSEDVQSITGDQGCRAIFGHHTRGILEVPVDDPGILVDLDTPEQITRAEEVVRTGRSIEGLVAMAEHDRSHGHPPGGAMRIEILQVAQDLQARNEPFVLATVVRVERPSSGRPGFKAIVRANRDLVGWLGGSCAQSVLVAEGFRALRDGVPRLMRLTPTPGRGPPQEGVVEYIMECASGGTMDIYLEPHLPKPQLLVVGDGPRRSLPPCRPRDSTSRPGLASSARRGSTCPRRPPKRLP